MRRIGIALSLLAVFSFNLVPVAANATQPSVSTEQSQPAAAPDQGDNQKMQSMITRSGAVMLTQDQLDQLKASNPGLHKRLLAAVKGNTKLHVTPNEARKLFAMTEKTKADVKAGAIQWAAILSAIVVIIPLVVKMMNTVNPGSGPAPGAVEDGTKILCIIFGVFFPPGIEACLAAPGPAGSIKIEPKGQG